MYKHVYTFNNNIFVVIKSAKKIRCVNLSNDRNML